MENKKIFFTEHENGDQILKTGEYLKKTNEEIISQLEKDIERIDQLIKDLKAEILKQEELIFKLNKLPKNELEDKSVDLKKAEDHLWFLQKEFHRNIAKEKRIFGILGKRILSKIDISSKLKELEKMNLEFKKELLTKLKRSDN